jgi:hypothetical protein
LQSVIFVSSKGFEVVNILKGQASHAWKGKAGDKQNIVVLQFMKAQEITAIDIGNAGKRET